MKQNSSINNSNNNKLLVLIVESGKNIPCSCWGQTLKSLCQVYSLIYQVLDVMTDSGMERGSTLSSLSVCFLPSMDYLWAGDDCSPGLQSGWLGSGKFSSHFLTHPKASLSHNHYYFAAPALPNVKIWFLFGQVVFTLSVLWKNSLIRTGVSGCNKYMEMHASSVHWTWPSLTKFHLFFSLGFICHVVSRNYSEFRFRNMKMVKSACKTRRGGSSNSSSSSPVSMDVTAPFG